MWEPQGSRRSGSARAAPSTARLCWQFDQRRESVFGAGGRRVQREAAASLFEDGSRNREAEAAAIGGGIAANAGLPEPREIGGPDHVAIVDDPQRGPLPEDDARG